MEIFPQKIDGAAAWLRKTAHPSKWPRICSHTPTTTRSKAHFAPENFRRGTLYFLGNPFTVFTVQVHFPLPFPTVSAHPSQSRSACGEPPELQSSKSKKVDGKNHPRQLQGSTRNNGCWRASSICWTVFRLNDDTQRIYGNLSHFSACDRFVSRQQGIVFESLGSLLKVLLLRSSIKSPTKFKGAVRAQGTILKICQSNELFFSSWYLGWRSLNL